MTDTRAVSFHEQSTSAFGSPLACPECGGGYVRLIGTPVFGGPEVVETDSYQGLLGFRGTEWQHRAECADCDTVMTLCLANHKGQTFIGWYLY